MAWRPLMIMVATLALAWPAWAAPPSWPDLAQLGTRTGGGRLRKNPAPDGSA